MIISCNNCDKKFEINSELIPEKGRLLECSSCNSQWFFKKPIEKKVLISKKSDPLGENVLLKDLQSEVDTVKIKDNLEEKIEISAHKKRSIGILNLILVFIISGIAFIILIDTFKTPISIYIPNIEFILYNLYESLLDIMLFFKDLS